ncbi:molybdopterin molybdotransferase MoeA [Athalassotoga saccharophila]|uniref:molybdopterin molybdotransferase MoeA n=1 Tax=Athalassotoga saccharophila TaxID=1441386 RepID=UPI00137A6394|nr:gephyrin-like molybdotransferase Glp [Athalassotoga saccharophila]BBJ28735.1 molybdopterin molybdenumtransferase [Athalassotoga saccharophila]
MKTLDELLNLFDGVDEIAEDEDVRIENSVGRILSTDIFSKYDFPPYNRAAMDGFAFRYADLDESKTLTVKDEILAGHPLKVELKNGECVRIMTGGAVPDPCDTVVEIESCEIEGKKVRLQKPVSQFANIAIKGEDLKKGELALKKGNVITSNKINLIASLGMRYIKVKRKLRIGILSTGDELVDIDEEIEYGQIRNSSKYSLMAQISAIHQDFFDLGISRDDEEEIKSKVKDGMARCDILLITGGSSVGDKDLTMKVLEDLNAQILVDKLAIKPGAPTIIAKIENKWIFGLPGNPVSTYLSFLVSVLPLVEKLTGSDEIKKSVLKGRFVGKFKKHGKRTDFVPCQAKDGVVMPIKYNGSGDFTSLSNANAFFIIYPGTETLKEGDIVDYFFID